MDAIKLLKLTSTVGTGIIAGGAIYINIVEHPARMELDDSQSLHRQWRESFDRAKLLMAGTSLHGKERPKVNEIMISSRTISVNRTAFVRNLSACFRDTEHSITESRNNHVLT